MKRIRNYCEILAGGDVVLYRMERDVFGQRVGACAAITRVEIEFYRADVAAKLRRTRDALRAAVAKQGDSTTN